MAYKQFNTTSFSWTPVLKFGGGTTGITYSVQEGYYYDLNNTIVFQLRITLTNKGSSTGSATITGLPITPAVQCPCFVKFQDVTVTGVQLTGLIRNSSGFQILLQNNVSGSSTSDLTNSEFTNSSALEISGIYIIP